MRWEGMTPNSVISNGPAGNQLVLAPAAGYRAFPRAMAGFGEGHRKLGKPLPEVGKLLPEVGKLLPEVGKLLAEVGEPVPGVWAAGWKVILPGRMADKVQDKPAIILTSGGLDSTTCLAIARDQGYGPIYSLTFDYGQRHRHELEAARQIAAGFNVAEHRVMTINLRQFGHSALTDDIAVPKDRPADWHDVPITYVPARNTIFLSYALAWGEVLGAADLFIGVNAVDYSGYPDCRPAYIAAFEAMANLATAMSDQGRHLTIHAPLLHWSKGQIIRRGVELGVDYSLTHSCYDPDEQGRACGHCDSCLLRKKGFEQAGVADPTRYAGP